MVFEKKKTVKINVFFFCKSISKKYLRHKKLTASHKKTSVNGKKNYWFTAISL